MTVIVAVLAGGAGTRIGGQKAGVMLAGRPLIAYPLEAARRAGLEAVIFAKASTTLPPTCAAVVIEPAELPRHPLSGIVTALRSHEAIVALPCDMPFVTPALLRALADAGGRLVTTAPGQPFPGLYRAALLDRFEQALREQAALRSVLRDEGATALSRTDPGALFSVNSPADLAEAERRLAAPQAP